MSSWDVVDILEAMGHDPVALSAKFGRAAERMEECCVRPARRGVAGFWIEWRGRRFGIVCPSCLNQTNYGSFASEPPCPECDGRGWRSINDFRRNALPRAVAEQLIPYVAAHVVAGHPYPLPEIAFDRNKLACAIGEIRAALGIWETA